MINDIEQKTRRVRSIQKQIAMGITTKRQELCLDLISWDSEITTSQLAKFLKTGRGSVNQLTEQLQGKGLIVINKGLIGRKARRFYGLTEAGSKAVEEGGAA